jgi:hypothetical protein
MHGVGPGAYNLPSTTGKSTMEGSKRNYPSFSMSKRTQISGHREHSVVSLVLNRYFYKGFPRKGFSRGEYIQP